MTRSGPKSLFWREIEEWPRPMLGLLFWPLMEAMKALTDLGKASITDCQKVLGGKLVRITFILWWKKKKALSVSFYINTLIINIQKLNDFCSAVKSQKHLVNTEILVETFYINTLIINIQKMNDFSSKNPVNTTLHT